MRRGMFLLSLISALVFSGCGGGGGGGTQTTTSSSSTTYSANAALGPIQSATVTLYTQVGSQLYQTTTKTLQKGDTFINDNNASQLVSYESLQVGKFFIPVNILDPLNNDAIVHIVVSGGEDVDPDDDALITDGEIKRLTTKLEAYVKAADLKSGAVTVNAFTTLATEFLASQNITDLNASITYLSDIAKNIFGESADFTSLYKFNPAKHATDGTIVDLAKLRDPNMYSKLLSHSDFYEHFYNNRTFEELVDNDQDALPGLLEVVLYADDSSSDSDGDGINDYSEIFSGTFVDMSDASEVQDPLFEHQWHLSNTGQTAGAANPGVAGIDLNVTPVWPIFSGNKNITVAVIDTGIEANHTDFTYQIDLTKSYRYSDQSNDPTPDENQLNDDPVGSAHGTACAGIIAAKSNNGIGVKGIAPDVTLIGLNVFSDPTDSSFGDALSKDAKVLSNSWGIAPEYVYPTTTLDSIIEDGAKNLQKLYIFAAGNERDTYGNANYSSLLTTPYTINVAALDANGTYASYSNFGANILITAPAGEFGVNYPAIVTTDLSGLRYGLDNSNNHFDAAGNEDGNYTNRMNGTSSACPCVSGVTALMLDANPKLTYREVAYILAHTARKVDSNQSEWSENGAGLWFNPNYGFGLVDAYNAVMMAKSFQNLPTLQITPDYTYEEQISIPDNNQTGISFDINVSQDMNIEYVNLWIDLDHTFVGDLEITLTSPAGTVSKLAYPTADYKLSDSGLNNWRFGSVQFMDEKSQGSWKVTIRDLAARDTGTFKKATLRIYGH